jgi:transposase
MDAIAAAHHGDIQMIDSTSVRAHQQAATAKRGVEITVWVARAAGSQQRSMSSSSAGAPDPARPDGRPDARQPNRASAARPPRPAHHRASRQGLRADRIRALIEEQGATPNSPAKSNRKWKPCFSERLYRERNLIERLFSKLKHFRRIATRYDKLAENFLAMVQLASMRLWLRAYESTA